MASMTCDGRPTREINAEIKRLLAEGHAEIVVKNPAARHNLAVGVVQPCTLIFEGSVGYYCGGMIDGPHVEIKGSAGWGLAESMMNGRVVVHGNAGNAAAAAIRGGSVIIHGDAAARAGIAIKGGVVLIEGNCGYMAGFMGQKGVLVVCGDAGEAFADSMYETICFVGGRADDLGNDAVVATPTDADVTFLSELMVRHGVKKHVKEFKKIVSGRKLWNFDKREWKTWSEAL
ncbi:MAG: glutamate synthase [Planctomycetes bacterium]|nr:glutamate synthase [Planctomycetota bacterium]